MSERRFGILIASSRFPNEPMLEDLRFPENDVDGLNELLASQDHGQFTQTFVLKNKLHHEILLKINQVLREADKNDLVLIYYSGHGKLNPAGKLHLTSTDSVINALEATSIPVSTIKDYVDVSSSNKIVLILDCCFSGAAGEAFARSGVDDQIQLVSGGRGTYIMTASTVIQVAQEKESDQYGVFTKHMIEGIKSGDADLDSNGSISMGELYRYVHDHVLDEGFQEPMKWDLNVRGELVIARSGKTPREERRKHIREILFDLAKKGLLPDDILDKARQVIALEPDQISEEDLTYDRLLDQLQKKRLEPVEFIREWDKVRPEKPDFKLMEQEERKRKAEEKRKQNGAEAKRKADEEKRCKEKEELKRISEEEERKRKEAEKAEERAEKAELERKAREAKEDLKRTPASPKSRKKSNALKFVVAAGVIVMLITGIWWYISELEKEKLLIETKDKIERLIAEIKDLERNIAKIESQKQLDDYLRGIDYLSHKARDLKGQAAKTGLESQLEELQGRLKQIQIQLANKERELFADRRGRIFVESVPDNAMVRILNIDQGFQQGMELEPGKYHVEVSSEGYEPQDRWIELGPREEKRINFELEKTEPKVGKIFVATVPEYAQVRILNIKPKFVQGMELDPGNYHVEVVAERYESQDRWIYLNAGEEKRIHFELEKTVPKVGWLYVDTVPGKATVKILNIDEPFRQGMELKPGSYDVEVAAERYETERRRIELEPGKKKRIIFELEKIIPKIARLFVKTFPKDATVRILNINPKFSQGMALEPGEYHLQVSFKGYEPQERLIELGPGEEKEISFELKKMKKPTPTPAPAPTGPSGLRIEN
jgi:predicted metallopeptidase